MSCNGCTAYYGDKAMGLIDGGSVAGRLVFEALYSAAQKRDRPEFCVNLEAVIG